MNIPCPAKMGRILTPPERERSLARSTSPSLSVPEKPMRCLLFHPLRTGTVRGPASLWGQCPDAPCQNAAPELPLASSRLKLTLLAAR